jgi:hypothetical protein
MSTFVLIMFFLIHVSAQNCIDELCGHGMCVADKCMCDDGWLTFANSTECDYEQKSRTTAFWLEFFFAVGGAGYIYLGYLDLGIYQMVIFSFGLGIGCFCIDLNYVYKDNLSKCCIFIIFGAIFTWWSYVLIEIGTGKMTDDSGAPITGW